MKALSVYFFLLVFLLPATSIGQKFIFKEIRTDTVRKYLNKILIVGIGSVETRHFSETLSSMLIKKFKLMNIESEFHYLGKDPKKANEEVKTLLTMNFDAVMVFAPSDSSFFSLQYITSNSRTTTNTWGDINIQITTRSLSYSQYFYLQLYELANPNNLVWEASLDVAFDPTEQNIYSRITQKIISSLKTKSILK